MSKKKTKKTEFKVKAVSSVYPTTYQVVDGAGYVYIGNLRSKSRAEEEMLRLEIKSSPSKSTKGAV